MIYFGWFERSEQAFLRAFLRAQDVFVDVGANIGLFSMIASRLVGDTGTVHAFEPCQSTFRRLQGNAALNRCSNLSCHQLALSNATESIDLFISKDGMDAWNSLANGPYAGNDLTKQPVQAIRWDEFAAEHDLIGRTSLMKIDVEGWELNVLRGATETLSRSDAPVLQVEFNDEAACSGGSSCRELYRALERFGYDMFRYDQSSGALIPEPVRDEYGSVNLFATKNVTALRFRLRGQYG